MRPRCGRSWECRDFVACMSAAEKVIARLADEMRDLLRDEP